MYPGKPATERAGQPAFIMAGSGEAVTYAAFEARSNRLAHLFRAHGLKRLDHYAVFMENNSRYLECCAAGERAGLYYTCVNSYLTADEPAYIVNNSASRALITSRAMLDTALAAVKQCPNATLLLVADGEDDAGPFASLQTAAARSADGSMSTAGDVGYVDADRFLYLTGRATFMIISGGVNIYPQECENRLITHPKVADAAVFGVPNADLGEQVKAVVQPMPGEQPGPELERELLAFCGAHLARYKCPRSVDFAAELPRLPTGKLYKRNLRDRYWGNWASRIL